MTTQTGKKPSLTLVKVGGKVVENPEELNALLESFAKIEGYKVLVHGGGALAGKMLKRMGIEPQMHEGRRITNAETLEVVTMVYGGLVNKNIVAQLQSKGVNAIGLSGADMNTMLAHKRPVGKIDYGFAGDVDAVNANGLQALLQAGAIPVLAPITHDGKGQLLNTNADTIAGQAAIGLAKLFEVRLIFGFEKNGVLRDLNNEDSVIELISEQELPKLSADGTVADGMLPKLKNCFDALHAGVQQVQIRKATAIGDNVPFTEIVL